MSTFRTALIAGALSLAFGSQVVAAERSAPVARPRAPAATPAFGPSERDIDLANDPHRRWWDTYHAGEAYQAAAALAAHRLFCQDHPSDSTCAGWDWH